ncbi:MAG: 50S ribosomal protein L24 [Candidatus Dormibacteraeota bacterium]|nr:50S ribosomal protein L24 [Candidatus Dormibacteraeota bacterium]
MTAKAEHKRKVHLQHEGWFRGRVRPLDIRQGDTVEVIAGKDKGKRGVVERTLPEQQRVAVRGVNLLKRHTRAGVKGNMQGGIIDFDGPIPYSNVMLVCSRCDKTTRISHGLNEQGRRVIICKKCGERHERASA